MEDKIKSTFNLASKSLDDLDQVWMKLRTQLKDKKRITKSLIVEKAIEAAIEDLEKMGSRSSFLIRMSE